MTLAVHLNSPLSKRTALPVIDCGRPISRNARAGRLAGTGASSRCPGMCAPHEDRDFLRKASVQSSPVPATHSSLGTSSRPFQSVTHVPEHLLPLCPVKREASCATLRRKLCASNIDHCWWKRGRSFIKARRFRHRSGYQGDAGFEPNLSIWIGPREISFHTISTRVGLAHLVRYTGTSQIDSMTFAQPHSHDDRL